MAENLCEWAKDFESLRKRVLAMRKDSDYDLDAIQYEKFERLIQFFKELDPSEIQIEKISPKEENGGITVFFPILYLHGEQIADFCERLKCASALTIDPDNGERICISITVPDIFVNLNRKE